MEDALSRVWENLIGRGSSPVEALIVANRLAIVPYLLLRGPIN